MREVPGFFNLILCAGSECRTILESLRHDAGMAIIPLIATAPQLVRSQLRQAIELSASDYLVEPFDTGEFLQAIQTQLKKHSISEQWFTQHSVHFFRQFRQLHGTTPQSWRSHNQATS